MKKVEDLDVFKLSHSLALEIFEITKSFPEGEKFGLISQMRRAAYSVPMNLMEGAHRLSSREYRQFVGIARGSRQKSLYFDCHSGLDPESSISELDSSFRGNDGFRTNVKKRWTHYTRGSAGEMKYPLLLVKDLRTVSEDRYCSLLSKYERVSQMLTKLSKTLE